MKTTREQRRRRQKREEQGRARTAVKAAVQELTAALPSYAEELFKPYRYKVLWGGRGGARSWTFARTLLIRAAQRPTRVLCAREFQTSIKDSVHQLLKDQIAMMGLTGFTVLETEIRHTNGSLFVFKGLHRNVHTIKSLEGIDVCWVEEAERVSKESWSALIPTIRTAGSEIWVSFNPDQEEDSTYQRFVVNPPPNSLVIKVSWEDNPFLTQELIDEKNYAYATDPDSANHVWGGELRRVTKAQILSGKWFVQEFIPDPIGHDESNPCPEFLAKKVCPHAWSGPYQGLDYGFAEDPLAATRSWVFGTELYVEYEFWGLHVEIDDAAKRICDVIPGFEHYVTRADSARPDSTSYLRRHGLPRIQNAKKGPGSVEDGVAHLRSYTKIIIHPRCPHWRDEAKRYSYKVDERSGDILPVIVDKHNHLIDAERYSLEPLIKPQRRVGTIFPGVAAVTPVAPVHTDHPHTRLIGINTRSPKRHASV